MYVPRALSRFLEGQSYLKDMIHPGLDVGLELGNIYLNLVEQVKGADKRGGFG